MASYASQMAGEIDVRVIREESGRWAARSNALPTCIGYGADAAAARAEFDVVRSALEEKPYPVRLERQTGGTWKAQSMMYPGATGTGPTPAAAIEDVRREEANEFGADFEDYGHYTD